MKKKTLNLTIKILDEIPKKFEKGVLYIKKSEVTKLEVITCKEPLYVWHLCACKNPDKIALPVTLQKGGEGWYCNLVDLFYEQDGRPDQFTIDGIIANEGMTNCRYYIKNRKMEVLISDVDPKEWKLQDEVIDLKRNIRETESKLEKFKELYKNKSKEYYECK